MPKAALRWLVDASRNSRHAIASTGWLSISSGRRIRRGCLRQVETRNDIPPEALRRSGVEAQRSVVLRPPVVWLP